LKAARFFSLSTPRRPLSAPDGYPHESRHPHP
jgi:hypothetical protein